MGNINFKVADMNSARSDLSNQPESPMEGRLALKQIQHNAMSERCCGMVLGKILFHNVTRISLLFVYALLIAGAIYFAMDIKVYFSSMYFVSENSSINDWFEMNQEYF